MKRLAILLSALLWLQTAASGAEPWFRYFSDGHAVIKQGSLYGFADRNGAEVIPCRYTKAYPFNDGIAMVRQGYEVFAIDTLGNRLGTRVKIPQFYNQDFEYFVRWVCSRLPFVSDNEYAQLRSEVVNAVVTIGRDGRITGCESVSACDPRALRKVRSIVMEAPAWSPGLVDGEPVEIRYLLPVNFRHLRPIKCHAVDAQGNKLNVQIVYPLFQGEYASRLYPWFFRNIRYKSGEYQRAASGTVRVAFTVDKKGKLRDIEILRAHNDVCREKTIETLKKSPRWTPGTANGVPVDVRYETSFKFQYRSMAPGRPAFLFTALALLTVALFTADRLVGSVSVAPADIWAALTGGDCDPAIRDIILRIRLLKAVTALLAGAALAASGLQMQTLFRNPLAGPYVLGISSGAGLGVALFLLGAPLLGVSAHSFVQSLGIAGAAWLGAALVLLVVMAVSRRIKDIMVILILGMMFGSGISSIVEILQYLSSEAALKSFVIWTMGSLGDVTGGNLALMLPVVAAGLVLSVAAIKPLNLLLLGENYARTMGLNVQRTRTLLFLSTVLLAGTVTAFCGPVGFIGLAVPHLARMLFASADHRILMPGSMLAGAALLLVCDLISKTLALPINTVTALMGIPVVIIVVVRNRNLF